MTYHEDQQQIDVLGAGVAPTDGTNDPTIETDAELAELAELAGETDLVVVEAERFVTIREAHTYQAAAAFLTETVKPALKKIEETWRPMQRKTQAAHLEVVAQRRAIEDPLLEAERLVKGGLAAYDDEQDRLEAEAERQRQAAARKVAEQEQLDAAEHLEKQGHLEAAVERLDAPTVPVMPAPAPRAKARGVSSRPVYKFRVLDPAKVSRGFLKVDRSKVLGVVRKMGPDAEELVGGIEVYQERQIGARAR
ncbi:hypothetical protein LCGC14_0567880 [marine sediment metagenome]|uniref:Uncharacterized protein n=1 Tax=marine sediment metagenome TaxID=412755 RepID=A0A0F9UTB6_9ZZZZ